MTRDEDRKSRSAGSAGNGATCRRVVSDQFERVMRELEAVSRPQADPIVEELKQCPEAFKAGEMIGKMLDSLKYSQANDPAGDRYLPPAGTVIPPLA
jgi:hypothetical protein